jgi:hypothetical protein
MSGNHSKPPIGASQDRATPSSIFVLPDDAGLERLLRRVSELAERLAVYAFFGAVLIARDGLRYRSTIEALERAAIAAGVSESDARKAVLKGFAYHAAGHIDPPAPLVSMRLERRERGAACQS